VREVLLSHRRRIVLSLLLVVAVTAGEVTLPFVLGRALDGLLAGSYSWLVVLVSIGVATTLLGTVRRLHDVRLYSRIYEEAGTATLEKDSGLSANTARLNMLREVIDFFEYSLPDLIAGLVAFVGSLVFLASLNVPVFVAALAMAAVIIVVYASSTGRTMHFNREYNDEYERQVDVLRRNDLVLARSHIGLLNRWNIRLSDVDTINFAVSLTLTVALQVFAIVYSARIGMDYGVVLSVVLYVFDFSATASMLPDSWQQYLRLRDITTRLRTFGTVAD
jgi:hypothetical protein